jgi:hypothetical protein
VSSILSRRLSRSGPSWKWSGQGERRRVWHPALECPLTGGWQRWRQHGRRDDDLVLDLGFEGYLFDDRSSIPYRLRRLLDQSDWSGPGQGVPDAAVISLGGAGAEGKTTDSSASNTNPAARRTIG